MNIAIFGGTFDPPHNAHIQVLKFLLDEKKYQKIWVIPSPKNPLKQAIAPFEDRYEMCRRAFGNLDPAVQVKDEEKTSTGYTVDLIGHLLKKYPGSKFTFVGGSDLKKELAQWKDSAKLKQWIEFKFLPRPPDPDSPFPPFSSTEIRERIGKNLPVRELVPEEVEKYIREKHLYAKETS